MTCWTASCWTCGPCWVTVTGASPTMPMVAGVLMVTSTGLGGGSVPATEVVRWCRSGNAPPEFLVGVSCHSIAEAREAESAGASYVFFGPIFDTPSKRSFGPAQGTARLAEVCQALRIPVIAIGGINEENGTECIRARAAGIAAVRFFQEPRGAHTLNDAVAGLHHLG